MKQNLFPLLLFFFAPGLTFAGLIMLEEPKQAIIKPQKQIVKIEALPAQKEIWKGKKDSSLRKTILQWAEKAHWDVIWDAKADYPLLASVEFEGSFEEAVGQFIELYETAQHPLHVDIQKQQSLIYISTGT
jgi:hypothetical protein